MAHAGPCGPMRAHAEPMRAHAGPCRQGAAEKIKRGKTTCICTSSQKNVFILVRFWAFLGKGSSKTQNTRKQIDYVSKKFTGEIFFRWGVYFPGELLDFFFFRLFCCVG
jgi:hypothetical protein